MAPSYRTRGSPAASACLRSLQRGKVARALRATRFAEGKRIISQGQAGSTFYLISNGTVVITVGCMIRQPTPCKTPYSACIYVL
jgi:hypothetical protein